MSSFKPLGKTVPAQIAAWLYSTLTGIRNRYYTLLSPQKNKFPTISIGGISAGGTGKTPLTDLILKELYERGYTPVLFSRGYGRKNRETTIVKPYEKRDWHEIGDEPAMLKRKNPFIWLAIDSKRTRVYKKIEDKLPQNAVLVMDDGFQHRQFHRDIDIVTLPVSIIHDTLIPMGLMREPLQSLQRASIILIMSNPGEEEELSRTLAELSKTYPQKKIISVTIKTEEWHSYTGGKTATQLHDEVTLLSGIARPQRFINAARKSCSKIHKVYTFPDHHVFTSDDFRQLNEIRSPIIGTTEKDLIRLNSENFDNREKLWYLIAVVCFNSQLQKEDFFEYIDKSMRQ